VSCILALSFAFEQGEHLVDVFADAQHGGGRLDAQRRQIAEELPLKLLAQLQCWHSRLVRLAHEVNVRNGRDSQADITSGGESTGEVLA
jgi:hypothetical protein